MPSLPLSSTPVPMMLERPSKASTKYREAAYHQDGHGRYVAQSSEVRSPPRQSPPGATPLRQYPQLTEYSPRPLSVVRTEVPSSKTTPRKSVIIVQSREGLHTDGSNVKPGDATLLQSTAPPPSPRPQRLATPELSDIDDDRPFCNCDLKKDGKCCASYRRSTGWRLRKS